MGRTANALGRIYTSEQFATVALVAPPLPPPPAIIQYAPAAAEAAPAAAELAPIVAEAAPIVAEAAPIVAEAAPIVAEGVAAEAVGAVLVAEASVPVWGWIALAVTVVVIVGIGAYELSQSEAETEAEAEAEDNVQVREGEEEEIDEKDPCDIKPYDKQDCPPGKQKHHIVSDFVLRYGRRADTASRIPGMPSLGEGPTICVDGNAWVQGTEHNELQRALDGRIADAGGASGKARLRQILEIAIEETIKFRPECEEQIRKAIEEAFKNADMDALIRTTYATQEVPSGPDVPEADPDQSIPF